MKKILYRPFTAWHLSHASVATRGQGTKTRRRRSSRGPVGWREGRLLRHPNSKLIVGQRRLVLFRKGTGNETFSICRVASSLVNMPELSALERTVRHLPRSGQTLQLPNGVVFGRTAPSGLRIPGLPQHKIRSGSTNWPQETGKVSGSKLGLPTSLFSHGSRLSSPTRAEKAPGPQVSRLPRSDLYR